MREGQARRSGSMARAELSDRLAVGMPTDINSAFAADIKSALNMCGIAR